MDANFIKSVFESFHSFEVWNQNPDSDERRALSALHFEMYGEKLSTKRKCGCVLDFVNALKSAGVEKIVGKLNQMANKLFHVKKGKLIQNIILAEPLTSNTSDAECMKLLKHDKRCIKFFEDYPENWEELVDKFDPKAKVEETPAEETPAEEVNADMKSFEQMTEAELRAYAKDNGVNLTGLKLKKDVLAAVIAHVNDI